MQQEVLGFGAGQVLQVVQNCHPWTPSWFDCKDWTPFYLEVSGKMLEKFGMHLSEAMVKKPFFRAELALIEKKGLSFSSFSNDINASERHGPFLLSALKRF